MKHVYAIIFIECKFSVDSLKAHLKRRNALHKRFNLLVLIFIKMQAFALGL